MGNGVYVTTTAKRAPSRWVKPVGHLIGQSVNVLFGALAIWVLFGATDVPTSIRVVAWVALGIIVLLMGSAVISGSIRQEENRKARP